ncbi:MAG TPA: LysR family transcriptional regulator [Nitrosomonas nitrosa]|jgi:LysR family transcriptional regulator for metE and metH|uniref:HTH-type transcriptional regulator MetR n=1 Tax=Nitrosomonas nitrosa TaxID=52442 RepID=A0A8E0RCI7_9PROT|nr:LysR family transcriptional regulator [Nitrosomonas nitrosa]MCO6433091.1 LysR family transcriptional regulator [Nitrosomonas nitrosa]PTQ95474.1 LysR family transcriptional regulator for metE and metH [Nitrosomonas nitrosa]CAE6501181.1 HTH-type transcriptional regulator MetR [Nitrosomonas nitrosa]HBZ31010.1 LysR family transcriptional regulator [Nitrosomonas nitrosa]
MIELRHLRTLHALQETGSLSLAAERVHLTQSALSHQIKVLQEYYKLPLIRRQGHAIQLTEPGKRLVQLAEKVIKEVQAAERDMARFSQPTGGSLRIALECHTCFDWLMPIMDTFREHWPEVELDLVSGFHADPIRLLKQGEADIVIGSENKPQRSIVHHPLFRFEILAVLAPGHELGKKRVLHAADFANQTLITYPVPEERIDLISHVLTPAGIVWQRRTAELTIAILQLVASRRGIAALPNWGIKSYVDHDYVIARRIGTHGLWSDLFVSTRKETAALPYLQDFLITSRDQCFTTLDGIVPLRADE